MCFLLGSGSQLFWSKYLLDALCSCFLGRQTGLRQPFPESSGVLPVSLLRENCCFKSCFPFPAWKIRWNYASHSWIIAGRSICLHVSPKCILVLLCRVVQQTGCLSPAFFLTSSDFPFPFLGLASISTHSVHALLQILSCDHSNPAGVLNKLLFLISSWARL